MRRRFALAALLWSALSRAEGPPTAVSSLADAERAFAKMSVAEGIRASFLANFADDGIDFEPAPAVFKESIRNRPAPPAPPPVTLDWEPVLAEVSKSGDFGFTTGPYVFLDRRSAGAPPAYGYYFSIWKRALGGPWKVAVDAGIGIPASPGNLRPRELSAGRTLLARPLSEGSAEEDRLSLIDRDRELSSSVSRREAFLPDARLHRDGLAPLVGTASIGEYLSRNSGSFSTRPAGSGIAASRDLGYTYGSYESGAAPAQESGYYVRMWKRDAVGAWKLAVEIERPNPAEAK